MQKQQSWHHSVTENGKIQVRLVTEYIKDGESQGKNYGDPMTVADPKKMEGWDDKTKDIVEAITDKKVLADFKIEKQEPTGVGVEEIVTYDRTLDDLGRISVRRITRIFDEGKEVSKQYHRSWIIPGDNLDGSDVMSKAIAKKLHTSEVINKHKDKMKENKKL